MTYRKRIKCKQCGKPFHEPWEVAQHVRKEHPKARKARMAKVECEVSEPAASNTLVLERKNNDGTRKALVEGQPPPYGVAHCPGCGLHLRPYNNVKLMLERMHEGA